MDDGSSGRSGPERSKPPKSKKYLPGSYKTVKKTFDVYQCKHRRHEAPWLSGMKIHLKTHSKEKPYGCPHCSYRSKWPSNVVQHLKRRCLNGSGGTTHDVIDYRKVGSGSSERKGPVRSLHPTNDGNRQYKIVKKLIWVYQCTLCDYSSKSKWTVLYHKRVHYSNKPFDFSRCIYQTKLKQDMKPRLEQCDIIEKPFGYSKCTKRFKLERSMKTHLKKCGSDEKAYTTCDTSPNPSVSPEGSVVQAQPQAAGHLPDSEDSALQPSPQVTLQATPLASPAASPETQDTGCSANTIYLNSPGPSPIRAQEVQYRGSSILVNTAPEKVVEQESSSSSASSLTTSKLPKCNKGVYRSRNQDDLKWHLTDHTPEEDQLTSLEYVQYVLKTPGSQCQEFSDMTSAAAAAAAAMTGDQDLVQL